ncbi:nucleoside-diphosphate kinase [Paenibacillus sp. PK3_47]|uniref:nucleoside-diphosphate kinase n=1 Tax=Paenibacillus sp. PK3_47 TaxID=2072642 RepID=UPI00201DD92A|nr:nucleoside-diphosphate kinase [Paenibacillus sp. PK3_47]UQZ32411.1 nucleoside-diphosphate kinase [Paenibacillus sp. PK3_47]
MERTYLMIKPDGVQRGLIGRIVARLEDKGFKLIAAKLITVTDEQAKKHYAEHEGKDFFGELVGFITSGPVFAMVWEGDDVIALSRLLIGKTKVGEALPGTIRGDFASHTPLNLIHGSDSPESAEREIANFFAPDELAHYNKDIEAWM